MSARAATAVVVVAVAAAIVLALVPYRDWAVSQTEDPVLTAIDLLPPSARTAVVSPDGTYPLARPVVCPSAVLFWRAGTPGVDVSTPGGIVSDDDPCTKQGLLRLGAAMGLAIGALVVWRTSARKDRRSTFAMGLVVAAVVLTTVGSLPFPRSTWGDGLLSNDYYPLRTTHLFDYVGSAGTNGPRTVLLVAINLLAWVSVAVAMWPRSARSMPRDEIEKAAD